jgi:uncharacterized protein (DUF2252 family)
MICAMRPPSGPRNPAPTANESANAISPKTCATLSAMPVARARRHVHLGAEERAARGKAARQEAPRSSHGRWESAGNRPDPIALLEEQAESRVPELVPIRYGRMLESPFTFFRGAALIMAADLASTPRSGVNVQLCGDAHLSNFGVFGSPERELVFDINDFDETLPGPWEWDVKRLAASAEILGRDRSFAPVERRSIVKAAVREYRAVMRRAANMGTLDAWYDHLDIEQVMDWVRTEVAEKRVGKKEARQAEKHVAKARERDSTRVFAKRADEVDGKLRIVADSPLVVPIDDLTLPEMTPAEAEKWIRSLVGRYRQSLAAYHHPIEEFEYVHSARKVVGVGSVGTRAWIHLFVGRDDEDPLFLQSKEAEASVLERFVGESEHGEHGRRVVVGQRLMQAASDIFLGWFRVKGIDGRVRDYYVRQLHDWKGGAEVEGLRVPGATLYSRLCGATLARAHARWGDRIAIASYLGKGDAFDRAVAEFSSVYADQNERDFEAFASTVNSGRLQAQTGV